MALLDSVQTGTHDRRETAHEAATALETQLLKTLLSSSGAFKSSGAAGAGIRQDLFVDALAEAVAKSGEVGLGRQLEQSLAPGAGPVVPASLAPHAASQRQSSSGTLGAPLPASAHAAISSAFGTRRDPFDGHQAEHRGLDLAAVEGTPILAAQGGVVRRAGARGGYGEAVEIDHGNGITTVYAHASELLVHEGERVEQGQVIAKVGQTGRATGPHLHFELRRDGQAVDPRRALNAYRVRDE